MFHIKRLTTNGQAWSWSGVWIKDSYQDSKKAAYTVIGSGSGTAKVLVISDIDAELLLSTKTWKKVHKFVEKWNMNGGISHETRIIIQVVNKRNIYREYAVDSLHSVLVAGRLCCLGPQCAEGGCHNSSFELTDMPLCTF